MRRAFILPAALFICLGTGQGNASENYAGDFLSLGAGARALGMGNSFVVVTDGAVSSYHNPAGLVRLKVREFNFMHSEQFAGLINYNTVSFGMPLSEDLAMGLTLLHSGIGNIKYTRLWDRSKPISEDNRPEIASREDATDYVLFCSAAKKLSGNAAVGGSLKIIRRAIGPDTAFGFGIDLGLHYRISGNWTAGIMARDITGTTIAWDGKANDRIAATIEAGCAYADEMPFFGGAYILTASIPYFGDTPDVKGTGTMNIGGEYRIRELVAVRAGSAAGTGTIGLGIMRLPLISTSSLDYAYLSDDGLDSTHRVSMTVRF